MIHYNRNTDLLHVYPISVRPHVVGVVLDSMPQGTWNLVEPDEFSNLLHLCMITRRNLIQKTQFSVLVIGDVNYASENS